ncbi:unnamed protein product [Sphenostylis stenocarpa]|uniref:FAD/NAD(P)-binding domain-containing protein n=1 Tax=Sphenostylis stenocarpa TaxID=92480 RepID=A0AA86VLD4_9FABA|nr:unnamed protein product [Sphenostylis stenocarpa]
MENCSGGGVVSYSESRSDAKSHAPRVDTNKPKKKRVVVLGTGWAATSFLKDLDAALYDVQVVCPRNYFAFTPLLPSVTRGTVEARSIVEPRKGEIKFWEAECLKIDSAKKQSAAKPKMYRVISQEIEDAQKIRQSVIDCFEKSVLPSLSDEERRTNLHFIVVGGGPTDIVKITVIQSGDHILNTFDTRITSFGELKFGRDGIEIKTGCRVVNINDKEITVKVKSTGELSSLPHGLVVWSTGIATRPVVRDFMEQIGQNDAKGNDREETDMEEFRMALCHVDLQMKSLPANCTGKLYTCGFTRNSKLAIAHVASQQGAYLASCFNRRDQCAEQPEGPLRFGKSGRQKFRPFRYKHFGQFASLGGEQAAAELPGDWQASELAHKSDSHFRLDKKIHIWERLKLISLPLLPLETSLFDDKIQQMHQQIS